MNNPQVLLISEFGGDALVWAYGLSKRGISAVTTIVDDTRANASVFNCCALVVVDIDAGHEELIAYCHYLRTMFKGSILMFTYEHDERFHLQLYRAGADECIAKPIGTALALAKIMSWLRVDSPANNPHLWGSKLLGNKLTNDRRHII